ncbi:MAG TPA: glycosyltransferase family 39 protein, partial [Chloroflexota bacterium]|nr:glycosyltransferase family 39 protein [Chloroflexota bacterium]
VEAPFIALFGQTITAIRLLAGISGALGLAAFYLLIREQFGTRPALIALLLLAANGAAVNFSRLALNVAEVPLVMGLTFLTFWLAQESRRPVWWLLTGLLGGIGIYFHFDDRLVPIILGLCILYLLIADPTRWLDWLKGAGLTLLGSAIALGPMAVHLVNQSYHLTGHMTGRLITNNLDRMSGLYHTNNFAQILEGQILANLLGFVQGVDSSQFYTFAGMPLLVPMLGPLFVLGLVYVLLRVADRRYAFLASWFWVVVGVGGAMTIDSPQAHRLYPAVLPAVAGIAVFLEWVIGLVARLDPRHGAKVATAVAFLIALVAGYSDLSNYFGPAAENRPWELGTEQGQYLAALGSSYRAYTLGTPMIYFDFSVSQYLAPMVEGDSLQNPAVDLPETVSADKNLAFLVYAPMAQYLSLVESTYPSGRAETIKDHTGETLFTAYLVPKDTIARQQGLLAHYADTSVVEHQPGRLGGGAGAYPTAVTWSGSIFTGQPGSYTFQVGGGEARVVVNGTTLGADGKITLPVGWNDLAIQATLPSPNTRLALQWQPPGEKLQVVDLRWLDRRSLGGALQAKVMAGDQTLAERTDREVGFRDITRVVQIPDASSVVWTGRLLVTEPGAYKIGLSSSSAATVLLDRQTILTSANGTGDTPQTASVTLGNGSHALEVHYSWPSGSEPRLIELTWQPPNASSLAIVPPEDLGPP